MEYLFDTHFHLDLHEDINKIIREIEENQIHTIAVTNLPDLYRRGLTYPASKYIHWSLGFHPELILQFENQIPLMWELLTSSRFVGEVGLDFCNSNSKLKQISFFSELIERVRYDDNKILSIHSRKAIRDILNIVGTTYRFKPILHWYSGGKNNLIRAVENGFYFSLNHAMINSKKFMSTFSLIPKERILLETDSPFIKSASTYSQSLRNLIKIIECEKFNIDLRKNFCAIFNKS